MKKSYENDALSQKNVYNVMLVGFAILMIGLLISNGPPSPANPPDGTTSPEQDLISLQISPSQILWYEMRMGETRLSVERISNQSWQLSNQPDETINNQVVEFGAEVIASFGVQELIQFGPDDDLSQYGFSLSPRYIISFGVENMDDNINNSGAEQPFTLYIGDLNPSQQDYYVVFVDETDPQQPRRQGDWVYLMPAPYVDTLADVIFNRLQASSVPLSTDTGAPEAIP